MFLPLLALAFRRLLLVLLGRLQARDRQLHLADHHGHHLRVRHRLDELLLARRASSVAGEHLHGCLRRLALLARAGRQLHLVLELLHRRVRRAHRDREQQHIILERLGRELLDLIQLCY